MKQVKAKRLQKVSCELMMLMKNTLKRDLTRPDGLSGEERAIYVQPSLQIHFMHQLRPGLYTFMKSTTASARHSKPVQF